MKNAVCEEAPRRKGAAAPSDGQGLEGSFALRHVLELSTERSRSMPTRTCQELVADDPAQLEAERALGVRFRTTTGKFL